MESIAHAVDRLTKNGYADDFRAEQAGLHATQANRTYAPEDLIVDEQVRFEGASDPDEQAVLLALHTNDGVKGTWLVTYGPTLTAEDAALLVRLRKNEPVRH